MKRVILGIGLLCAYTTAFASRKNVVQDAKALTVIISNDTFGGSGRGTGILLDETHVLTCFHLLQTPKDELLIYTHPLGRVIVARPETIDREDDLAILVLESSAVVKHSPVFQETVEDGEPITAIGNALGGMKWFVTKGVISGQERGMLVTDALINPGNSGGPWINANGEIVALTDWRIGPEEEIPGMAGGIPAKTINRFLENVRMAEFMAKVLEQLKP